MAATNAAQLNMGYTYVYTAFLGKTDPPKPPKGMPVSEEPAKPKDDGAENFKPKNGGRRYSANQIDILAVINKLRDKFGADCRITHDMIERELGLAHGTVNRNLAILRDDEIIKRENGVNDYKLNDELTFSDKDYLTVYSLLFEPISFNNNTAPKKLTGNDVQYLCFMLRYYFQVEEEAVKAGKSKNSIKPEDAYFLGGKKRVASTVNVAESTASDMIKRLLNSGTIFRKALYTDEKGKEVICDGKGKSKDYQTVYILNTKLIRLCKKVRAQMDVAKKKRAKRAEKAAKQEEKAAEQEAREDFQQHTKKKQKHVSKAEQRQRDYEILQSLYEKDEQPSRAPRSVTEGWANYLSQTHGNGQPAPAHERPPTDDDIK